MDSGAAEDADDVDLVWYVSYGSNLCAARFACYLGGGRPLGAARDYPGCADPTPPRRAVPVWLPGGIYFALRSRVWGGGMAFYDPALPGRVAARGYLITAAQFADVVDQEMHRAPGPGLDLAPVLRHGRDTIGPGRYETLLRVGECDGRPLLTFTAPWTAADVEHTRPTVAYLDTLATGLRETYHWEPAQVDAYLAQFLR
ncbi:MAG TPA: histone deacetylase [Mycobacteriales bacterium]|nr:histone deacetylase [Mycobacteriales bacterium]